MPGYYNYFTRNIYLSTVDAHLQGNSILKMCCTITRKFCLYHLFHNYKVIFYLSTSVEQLQVMSIFQQFCTLLLSLNVLHNYKDVIDGWAARGRCIQYWTQRSPNSPNIMIIIIYMIYHHFKDLFAWKVDILIEIKS